MRAMNAVVALAAAVSVVAVDSALRAADHGDSAQVRTDTRMDINDVYAFASPETPANTVIAVTVCPLAGATGPRQFTPGAKYEICIDTNADAIEDQVYSIVFGKPDAAGRQSLKLAGPNKVKAKGTTEDAVITVGTGGKLFAGLRDDPFFFDLIGFKKGLAFSADTACNFFNFVNTMAIVLEVPSSTLGATNIGVFARTVKGKKQVDRMGRPAINTVLIAGADKDAFNSTSPRDDAANWRAKVKANLMAPPLSRSDADATTLSNVLIPDLLTYDTTNAGGFLNGRKLEDDVIDAELALLSNNAVTTDFVGNDSTFLNVFPYLGTPNP